MSHITINRFFKYRESGKYSWKGGVVVAFVSTILLWWLPVIGPLISGYTAGRVSGSKYRGLASSGIAVVVIGAVSFIFTYLFPVSTPSTLYLSYTVISHVNTYSAYAAWFMSSIGSTFTNFTRYLDYFPTVWAILLVSAFFGGSVSQLLSKGTEKKSVLSPVAHPILAGTKPLKPKVVDYMPEREPFSVRKILPVKRIIRREREEPVHKEEKQQESPPPVAEKAEAPSEPLLKIVRQEEENDSDTDYI